MTLVAAGCAASDPTPADHAPAAPTTAGTVIAAGAVLAPSDFAGAGWRARQAAGTSPPGWGWDLRQCILYDPAEYPAQQRRLAVRHQMYRQDARREATLVVERFETGWGQRSMADTRAVLDTCSRYEYTSATEDFRESHAIVARSFAGDESLLVESVRIAPPAPTRVRYTAVVRRGDLVVTVAGTGLTPAEVRRLAGLAAGRLV